MSLSELDQEQRKILQNRFHMMMRRADGAQQWKTFRDWERDFLSVAPSDFSTLTHRVSYDPEIGYTKEGMRIRRTSKRPEQTSLNQDLRILLASELTSLLLDPTMDLSLQELVDQAERLVGMNHKTEK